MSAVADKLREARALIERGWTQGQMARGKKGVPANADGPKAQCWCSVGAINAVIGNKPSGQFRNALREAIGCDNLVWWNDDPKRTQAEVLAAFDKAIELAEAGQ